jgi:hypothetical protein
MALDRASAALLLAVACLVGGCATAAAAAAAADGPVAVKDWRLEPKMELLQGGIPQPQCARISCTEMACFKGGPICK